MSAHSIGFRSGLRKTIYQLSFNEPHHEKTCFWQMRKHSLRLTAQLIRAFFFAKEIVQSLYLLIRNFSRLLTSSVVVQHSLCRTWLEIPKTDFLRCCSNKDLVHSSVSVRFFMIVTCLCNVDPLTPHFYVVKLGLQGLHFFLISVLKQRVWYALKPPE